MATLALFVALGGVGYAATKLPRDSVGSKQIKEDAVKASELAPDSVDSSNVVDLSLDGSDLADGSVSSEQLEDQSIVRSKLAPADVRTPELDDCSPGVPWQPVSGLPPHYWKDNEGIVHLEGAVQCSVNITGASIFQIPRGVGDDTYDPADSQGLARFATLGANQSIAQIAIVKNTFTTGVSYDAGSAATTESYVSLDGITYRADSG